MYSTPDANAGLTRHLDAQHGKDAERRADILSAAKLVDIADQADAILADPAAAAALFEDFINSVDPREVQAAVKREPFSYLGKMYRIAAVDIATAAWERRYGK